MSVNAEILFLVGIPLLIPLLLLMRRGRSASYLFCFALFYIYLLLVAGAVLFPIHLIGGAYTDEFKWQLFLSRINLKPFDFGPYATTRYILMTAIPNVLLTVPFGFGISLVARLKPWYFLWLPVVAGLALEGAQLVMSLVIRYPYRVIDINDYFMNAAGVVVGYALFRLFAWGVVGLTDWLRLPRKGLLGFFYETSLAHTRGQG